MLSQFKANNLKGMKFLYNKPPVIFFEKYSIIGPFG